MVYASRAGASGVDIEGMFKKDEEVDDELDNFMAWRKETT